MKDSLILGADIGGSHITVSLIDIHSRTFVEGSLYRHHVNPQGTPSEIVTQWCSAFSHVIKNYDLERIRIGIAMPGPFDYQKGISYIKGLSKYDSLYGLNVKELLAAELNIPVANIKMKNDAGCFLQGEVLADPGFSADHAIGVTLGTGIGTARYHYGVAEDADLWRFPYRDNVVEEYLATRWFVKRYHELTGDKVSNVKELITLFSGSDAVRRVFDEFSEHFSSFLAAFVNMDSPQVIIMGGNIAHASDLFLPRVTELLAERSIHVPIRKAILGEQASILGAAHCWSDQNYSVNVL